QTSVELAPQIPNRELVLGSATLDQATPSQCRMAPTSPVWRAAPTAHKSAALAPQSACRSSLVPVGVIVQLLPLPSTAVPALPTIQTSSAAKARTARRCVPRRCGYSQHQPSVLHTGALPRVPESGLASPAGGPSPTGPSLPLPSGPPSGTRTAGFSLPHA